MTVVVGRRGAGKTTLINRLLTLPDFADTAVVLNEFGHTELAGAPADIVSDGLFELGGGCICCTGRDGLSSSLERLLRHLDNGRIAAISRVVIEADASASPAGVLAAIVTHPYLVLRYRPDAVVAVAGADGLETRLDSDPVAVTQFAMADAIVVAGTASGATRAALRRLNPLAVVRGPEDAGIADATVPRLPDDVPVAPGADAGGEAGRVRSFVVRRERGMSPAVFAAFADQLAGRIRGRLLKIVGRTETGGERTAFRALGSLFAPVETEGDRTRGDGTLVVATVRDVPPADVTGLVDAFLDEARIDTPDRAALTDNPLAVAGFTAKPGR